MCFCAWGEGRESELEWGLAGGGNFCLLTCYNHFFFSCSCFNEFLFEFLNDTCQESITRSVYLTHDYVLGL